MLLRPRDKPRTSIKLSGCKSFCNKSILSNPKLQSNFLNAELVNLGIRGGEKRRGKVGFFSRQDGIGSAMLSVLIKNDA